MDSTHTLVYGVRSCIMGDDLPVPLDSIRTVMRLNSKGVATIQTLGSVTEWISSDTTIKVKP